MQAVQINQYGDNSVLENTVIPIPQPMPNQVLVQLKASSVNPVDYKIRSGYMSGVLPKSFPFTLGWEGAGIITEVGNDVKNYQLGDEIMLMANFMQGGTYAEYVAVNADEIMLKPKSLSFAEASVVPFSLGTAYTALIEDAQIKEGQQLLIHGAGGAVGQMAVQIAKKMGLRVIGTATGNNLQEITALGVDTAIDYANTDFSTVVKNVDVVLDLVGGETLSKSYALVKKGGMIVSTTQPPNAAELTKYGISGNMTQTRANSKIFSKISAWLETEKMKVKQPQVLSFSDAKNALSLVENRKTHAKIVLAF